MQEGLGRKCRIQARPYQVKPLIGTGIPTRIRTSPGQSEAVTKKLSFFHDVIITVSLNKVQLVNVYFETDALRHDNVCRA